MTLDRAQEIAFYMANLQGKDVTIKDIIQALVVLSNFYEDNKNVKKRFNRNKIT
jgi:hypothetical protein